MDQQRQRDDEDVIISALNSLKNATGIPVTMYAASSADGKLRIAKWVGLRTPALHNLEITPGTHPNGRQSAGPFCMVAAPRHQACLLWARHSPHHSLLTPGLVHSFAKPAWPTWMSELATSLFPISVFLLGSPGAFFSCSLLGCRKTLWSCLRPICLHPSIQWPFSPGS